MAKDERRLTIVQYAGDVREASQRLGAGGEENYGGQRYTVDYVEKLASRFSSVTTIVGFTAEEYDAVLPSGMRVIGAGFTDHFDGRRILSLLKQTRPDLLVLRSPMWRVLLWAMVTRCRTLLMLADSFNTAAVSGRVKLRLLATLLRSSTFEVVANHGRQAAEQLVRAGVPGKKVLAWDYPPLATPALRPTKQAASSEGRILFVGMLQADKGVFDVVDAAAILRDGGRTIQVDLVGKGPTEMLTEAIASWHLEAVVDVVGTVSNREVLDRMAQADIVVVPSRHEYPEGVPLTIYEAYCSRTPLVASDHPMFAGSVIAEESGLVFPAGHAGELARQICRLLDDGLLYRKLSEGGELAWRRMQNPVKWADLIDRWLDGSEKSRAWIDANSIAANMSRQVAFKT